LVLEGESNKERPEGFEEPQPGAIGIAFAFAATAGAARGACGACGACGTCGACGACGLAPGEPAPGGHAPGAAAPGEEAEAAEGAEEHGYAEAELKAEAEPEAEPEAEVEAGQMTAGGATLSGKGASFGALPAASCSAPSRAAG